MATESNANLVPNLHQELNPTVSYNPDDLVERVYPLPTTTDLPDLESQDVMGRYLLDRFTPPEGPRLRLVTTPVGHTLPGITRVAVGQKAVTRLRRTDPESWFIRPRTAVAVMVGSAAIINGIGNISTIDGAATYAAHDVYRLFDPVKSRSTFTHQTLHTPGKVSTISVTAASVERSGSTEINQAAVEQFVTSIASAEKQGAGLSRVVIRGNSSDEWGTDATIGVNDPMNDSLALERARIAVADLAKETAVTIPSADIDVTSEQHVLTATQKAAVREEAQADGYPTITDAIDAVDSGKPVPAALGQRIKQLFTGKLDRGVSLTATVEYPGKLTTSDKTTKHVTPGVDHHPNVPKPHFFGFIPMIPLRRRERYTKLKDVHHWKYTPSAEILRPHIIRETVDQEWLRIRPEAVTEDGTLVANSWAYTRKFEHLLRDDRIVDELRADFHNNKGDAKSLRILFVDAVPAAETVTAFEELLTKFTAMEDGKLADRIGAIFVYPTENAGIEHGDPKRIAMGVDTQQEAHVLGTYTYALDLVEMHMPSTWDVDELTDLLASFNGPRWVLAHEVGGHGTDETDQPLRLRRVHTSQIPNAHVITGQAAANKMRPLARRLREFPVRRDKRADPVSFDIMYQVPDRNGRLVTMRPRVSEDDPRLRHALESTIVGFRPTRYAGTNHAEHYAETAAATTTGISVPYEEASVSVAQLPIEDGRTASFADGFRPDSRGQTLFTKSVGAVEGSFPIAFSKPSQVTISHLNPSNDQMVAQHMIRTRHGRVLRPEQMIAILARVRKQTR